MKLPKIIMSAVLIMTLVHVSMAQNNSNHITKGPEAELAKIEETRAGFQKAIREGRYQDLGQFTTADVQMVGPGSADWQSMYMQAAERGTFPYDSIVMKPMETIIVSDSIAYDFGSSTVYFTDKEGKQNVLRNSFMAIIKKGPDGVWKMHREVASSRLPGQR